MTPRLSISLAAVLAATAAGCSDDTPSTADEDTGGTASTGDDAATSGTPTMTGAPVTTDTPGTTGTTDTPATDTLDDTTDSGETEGEGCGNGVIEADEDCDDRNLAEMTCQDLGFAEGALACTDACTFDSAGCCDDGCTAEGVTQCNGDTIEVCSVGDDGCLAWSAMTDCSATSEYCDATRGEASCLPVCIDQCGAQGDTQCNGDVIETCTPRAGAGGCLGWVAGDDCSATGEICDDATGAAACTCTDACAAQGDLQCGPQYDAVEVCGAGANGCLEWSVDTACVGDETCANVGGAPGCFIAPNYCIPTYSTGCTSNDEIDDFTIVDDAQVLVFSHLATDCSPDAYGDFTQDPALLVTLGPLVYYTFTATHNFNNQRIKIWIDFDQDGSFEDATELLFESPAGANPTVGSFIIPGTVDVPLTTRMRVMQRYASTPTDSCNPGGTFGETHDYTVEIIDNGTTCATFSAKANEMSPAVGSTSATLSPILTADFNNPVTPNTGVVTITGDLGTNLSYDLATIPVEVTFSNGNTTMTIDPGQSFPPGETLTVGWTGLQDSICATPILPPPWTFDIIVPPCIPGEGGMIGGTTLTPFESGLGSFTEGYVAADDDPNGWVYVGGTSALHRLPKAGGFLDLQTVPVASAQLGYDMLIVGSDIFTLESQTTGTTEHVWRISTDGGATWNAEDFASFPATPSDDFRGMAYHGGRIYMATHEGTSGVDTQIWSVDIAAPLPAPAVLEGLVTERYCAGIAVDDNYYYLWCGQDDRLVRVDRISFGVELITDAWTVNTTNASLKSNDVDADGAVDHLYLQSNDRNVYYVCDPGGALPYMDHLASFGASATTNYGMDIDPAAGALWTYHDASAVASFIRIE